MTSMQRQLIVFNTKPTCFSLSIVPRMLVVLSGL